MPLRLPNKQEISKDDPQLGEALQKVEQYVSSNTTVAPGSKVPPPAGFVNPSQRGG